MNKFELINKVLVSDLQAEDKCLLIELIVRADENWESYPTVERLCKVRGIKHEKNFKGADYYLPGLVTKIKKGRRNFYTINTPAVAGLSDASVVVRHTPALEGVSTPPEPNTPSVAGVNTPAVADNTPAVEGANTTLDTTEDSTTGSAVAVAPFSPNSEVREEYEYLGSLRVEDFPALSLTTDVANFDYLANSVGVAAFEGLVFENPEAAPEPPVARRFLTSLEKKAFADMVRIYKVTEDKAAEALELIETTRGPKNFDDAVTDALVAVGAVSKEEVEW